VSLRGLAARRVVTCDPARADALGVVDDGVVVFDGARIAYVGGRASSPEGVELVDLGDRVVTPGLIDAHTHACWVGSRHAEYAQRMGRHVPGSAGAWSMPGAHVPGSAGAWSMPGAHVPGSAGAWSTPSEQYRAIASAGGGILATHRAVAAASEDDLALALLARLRRMASLGVTTVEVKSGYGLERAHERKQLAAIARVAARDDAPAVVSTLLALHALPDDTRGDRAAYVGRVARELIPEIGRERLARFVDAYVDAGAFTVDEARTVAAAAHAAGMGVRLHVGQFADMGGAELAASLGAASADHLEHVSPAGIEALAAARVAVVLLPVASFTLALPPPPVSALRAAGIALVVASDANPGTAPTESLPLAMALAVRDYGLSTEEALLGTTRNAAAALGLGDRGVLREGARADIVVWDLPHEAAILQPWGVAKTHTVIAGGRELTPKHPPMADLGR
jgi:imidazolonepropionase